MTTDKKVAIFLFGRPASGKGTQAKLLADKVGFYHFTTSREGKEYIKTHDDADTKRQVELYKSGKLFEAEWTSHMVLEKTGEIIKTAKGIIYDGTPRTLCEAQAVFPEVVKFLGKENIYVFLIDISEGEFKKRVEKRLTCNFDSRHIYVRSESFMPGTPCPEGDGVLEPRDLDNKEVLQMRTDEYANKTMPAVKFIEGLHNIVTINGEQPIEDVHKDIIKALGL
ncbi:nucleoside monophosphate kinase [Candidatus Giovannonibacteria bacterium]|nr:nucleoside monophosphate kinase [Candidatus Giovannonibacteria bacterium]